MGHKWQTDKDGGSYTLETRNSPLFLFMVDRKALGMKPMPEHRFQVYMHVGLFESVTRTFNAETIQYAKIVSIELAKEYLRNATAGKLRKRDFYDER